MRHLGASAGLVACVAWLAGCGGAMRSPGSENAQAGNAAAAAGTSGGAASGSGGGAASGGQAGAAGTAAGSGGAGTGGASGAGGASAGGAGAGAGAGGGASGAGSAGAGAGGASGAGGQAGGEPPEVESPCPEGPFGNPLPPPEMRTAQLLRGGFDFLEGPVWIASEGVLLFSDMHFDQAGSSYPPSTIMRFTPPDTFEPFVESGSNGLALTPQGELLACTHDMQTLSIYDLQSKERETLALTYMGKRFNSPNDVTVRRDGTIYFTDPDWQLGGRPSETGITGVYRVPPGGEPELIDGSLVKPNGIALSPDQRTLYVGSMGQDVISYPVAEDGSVGQGTVFASPGASDGFAIDCAGNLYVTAGNVRVFDPQGNDLGTITVAETPANAAFGGPDRRTLYITARTGLYAIELNVPGYPY